MNASTLASPAPATGTTAGFRPAVTASALMSLMQHYECGEGIEDHEETETELMVLLSGMVGLDLGALDGE